jgi:hypothetical protein
LSRPLIIFEIVDNGQTVSVVKNEKGWQCSGYESETAFLARTKEAESKGWRKPVDPFLCRAKTGDCVHVLIGKILCSDESLGEEARRYSFLRKEWLLSRQTSASSLPLNTFEVTK